MTFFSGANILAVKADQSISFDICEERSECLFYLQNEMRRAGITQKDIDNARKSQEMNIIEDCKKFRHIHNHYSRAMSVLLPALSKLDYPNNGITSL